MLVGPERERDGSEIIDQGDGVAVLGEIDGAQIKFTGVAGLHADVGKLLGNVDRQFAFLFLVTKRAENPPKIPFPGTERAKKEPFTAVAFGAQHADEWPCAAQRANTRRCDERRFACLRRKELHVRLQEGAREKLREGADILVVEACLAPVSIEKRDPGVRRQDGNLTRRLGERVRRILFHQGKKTAKVRKQEGEVKISA